MNRRIISLLICIGSPVLVAAQLPPDPVSILPNASPPDLERNYRQPLRPGGPRSRLTWVNEFEPDASEKRQLAIDVTEQVKFADILVQPNTGLVRLLPFQARGRVVSVNSPEAYRRPGFSYFASTYSFSKKKHGNAINGWRSEPNLGWAELSLKNGIFYSGIMEESIGLMVRLGDVPLESVTAQTGGVDELDSYTPPADQQTARAMSENSARGIKVREFLYSSRIPANINTTYALRSVMNRRADILISFRVIRRDSDGSVVLLWKKLKDYPKPSWKRKR